MSVRSDITRSIAGIAAVAALDDNKGCRVSAPDTAELPEPTQPLERSGEALNKSVAELLGLFDRKVERVYVVCGIEQECFVIDGGWYNERADLMFTGRTLVGMPQPDGHSPEDRYAGLKDRVIKYMHDVRAEAKRLGFDLQEAGGHDGVAPNRCRFTRIRERTCPAINNNMLFMDVMKKVALWNNLACLLHEKPFAGVSGSGKRVSWALTDENGGDLLSPNGAIEGKLLFLTLAAAVAHAIHRHSGLLCAAAASGGNEDRLGAGEYDPPAAMSLSLGEPLTKIFAAIEAGGKAEKGKKRDFADLGVSIPPNCKYHGNDTSTVAVRGEAFEFRMPGGSTNLAMFVTVVNTVVADSIAMISERIKKELAKGKADKYAGANGGSGGNQHGDAAGHKQDTVAAVMNVLAAVIREAKPVLFEGDCRSSEWAEEARARGLPSAAPAYEALKAFIAPKSVELFGRYTVFSEAELKAMYDARLNQYCKTLDVEIKTLTDMVNTRVLPSAYNYQADIASGLEVLRVLADDMTIEMTDGALEDRKEMFEKLTADIYYVRKNLKELAVMVDKARGLELVGERAAYLFKEIKPQIGLVRRYVDALEGSMPDEMWPLPKYREMLFIL